jgi:hypothetical protein
MSKEHNIKDIKYGLMVIDPTQEGEMMDILHFVGYWKEQLANGMLGSGELNNKLNTLSNVAESVNIFIKVHKPGRFENLNIV